MSLVGPDGRIFGGGLAGMLVAAGPVQVRLSNYNHDIVINSNIALADG